MRPRPSGGQAPSVRGGGHHTAAGGGMAAAGMAAAAAGIGIGAVEPTGTGAGGGGGGTGGEEAAATAAAGGGCAAAAGVSVCVAEVGEAVPVSLTRSGAARGGGDGASPAVAAGGGCSYLATAAAGGSRAAESAPLPTLSACSSTPAAAAGTGGAGETAAAGAGGGSGGTSAFPSPATSCSSSVLEGETASPCSSAVSRIAQKQAQQQQPQHEQQTQHTLSAAASSPSPPPPHSSSSQPQQQRGKASSLERGGLGLLHLPVSKIAKTGSGKGHVASHKGSTAAAGSKAKRGGKQISSARINDSYAVSLPNALPLKQVIWAKDAMSGVWRLCSIVHARLRTSRPAPPSRSSVSRSVSPSVGGGGGATRSTCTTPQQQSADSSSSNARAGGVAAAAAFTLSSSSSSSSSSTGTAGCDATIGAAGAAATALPGPEDYDYYVHFLGFDRRLDQWKTWEEVREDEAELPVNEPVVKEVHDSSDEEHAGMDEDYLREHEEATKVKSIHRIRMGRYSVDTWYFSPYPKQYQNVHTLHICEFCLAFFKEETELARHMRFCECRHPPGNEIYRDKDIAMFEVDGNHCRVYCENLCFLSKLFLDHKTLRHPVSLFLFYVMTEVDEKGYHITGYFSKEKYSKNNVSCILTLPQHQRKGYGKFLINFSYSLSRAERKCGTPERPLSDLGKASYMAFWTEMILATIVSCGGRVSVQELSEKTCIETADIVACLEHQGVLRSKGDCFFLLLPQQKIKVLKEASGRPSRAVKPDELHWVPYDRYLMPFEYNPQA